MPVRTARLVSVIAGLALSAATFADQTSLTIYSSAQPGAVPADQYRPLPASKSPYGNGYRPYQPVPGYAVIRQDREMDLTKGRGTVRFTDVASLLDPTTVSFASLTDPDGTRVIEQNYQFDLVSTDKLLENFVDHRVKAVVVRGDKADVVDGVLMSSAPGQLILKQSDGSIQVVSGYSSLTLPTLPGGLLTKPTLIWDVASDTGGTQNVRVSYQTEGITWWADYNLVFTEGKTANEGTLDVGAWVSILNQSGATYDDAKLKLIAGSVHRAPQPRQGMNYPMAARAEMPREGEAGFEEKAFFEYHLYTLGRPTTIPDNSTKQVELFGTARGVPCEKVLVYDALAGVGYWPGDNPMVDQGFGTQSKKDVDVYLRFRNSKGTGMGMPLPAGRIRVSKQDKADGSMEFIGEDVIKHTPKDEQVLVKMGRAFDVVGERRQVDFNLDKGRRTITETIEVKVRNHKAERATVIVQEEMYRWLTWEITKASDEGKKIDSRTMHWTIDLDPDAEKTLTYTVRYTW